MKENLPVRSGDPRPMSDGDPTEWLDCIESAVFYLNSDKRHYCNEDRINHIKLAIEQLEGAIIELQQPVYGPTEPEWDEEDSLDD